MAPRVYTTQFLSFEAATDNPSYTCPAGYRAVIRNWDCYHNNTSLTDDHIISLTGWDDQTLDYFVVGPESAVGFHFETRACGLAGQTFYVVTGGQPTDGQVTGYLFLDPDA